MEIKIKDNKKPIKKSNVIYFHWTNGEFLETKGIKTENSFPVQLNPYEILELKKDAKNFEIELKFKQQLYQNPNLRAEICLAFEILCEPNLFDSCTYITIDENNDIYRAINYNEIYCAIVGDDIGLLHIIIENKNIVNEKDKFGRTLLYIAARNGHYKVCELLLENGANVNDFDNNQSTPLHAAVYYGHENIIKLLISYGADINQKNDLGEIPSDEAPSIRYKNLINDSQNDIILNLYHYLKSINLVERLLKIKKYNITTKNEDFIAIKFIPSYKLLLPDDFYDVWKNWDAAWHGTKLEYIESILKNGLKESGSILNDGNKITPQNDHVQFGVKLNNVNDWANAVFVSPSVFYSTHPTYSQRINSTFYGKSWAILIETRLLPGSYQSYKTTTTREVVPGEPILVEFRVKSINPLNKKKNIHIISISFVLDEFIKNVKDYEQGDILSNSEEERILFDK